MLRLIIIWATLLLGSAPLSAIELTIEDAWIREAPPMAKTMGGFMVLNNPGSTDLHLVSAASPFFSRVMIHRTVIAEGVARMVHQLRVTLPAGQRIEFKSGSYHLMLMHPQRRFITGDHITVTLKFSDGDEIEHLFKVLKGSNTWDKGYESH